MSIGIAIADSVVSVINASGLGEAERWYVPISDAVKDLNTTKISVVLRAIAGEALTRRSDDYTVSIDVAIQQRIPNDLVSNQEIKEFCDPLLTKMEAIVDLFRGKGLQGVPGSPQCMAFEFPFVYAPDHIDDHRVLTEISTLHFKVDRVRP